MLIRISLIIAILAGLAVGVFNVVKVKEKVVTLQTDLASEKTARAQAETDRDNNKKEWDKAAAELKQTKTTLETTTSERDKAVADAAAAMQRAEKLNDDLNKTRGERDAAQNELAQYKAIGMTPQQVLAARDLIKSLQNNLAGTQAENELLGKKLAQVQNELNRFIHPEIPVFLPASLKGKILVTDPKWNFVRLNVGENQGVLKYSELLVNRDGKLVAKVKVTTVEKDHCTANIMDGWQLGDVLEGDQVIPAHPASS
jgi:flagellar biosynthesis GTPase FlhF